MKKLIIIFAILNELVFMECLHPNVGLDVYQLIRTNGYDYELHHIETEDGYIIEMVRVVSKDEHKLNTINTTKPPILLMHGLLASSATWLNQLNSNNNLPFVLLENGYDVWLGNARGSTLSRRHKTLDPDKDAKKFWNFSWHEIGYYDLPGMIDYILDLTKMEQITYVGHSQGGTIFLVMASERPEYNKKIKIAFHFAASAIMKNYQQGLPHQLANREKDFMRLFDRLEIHELFQRSKLVLDLSKLLCDKEFGLDVVCAIVMDYIVGFDRGQMSTELIPVLASNSPAGISLYQIIHYMQCIRRGDFAKFDYHNDSMNMAKYGSLVPPQYDLSRITSPVVLYYGLVDRLVSPKDTLLTAAKIPNSITKLVDYPAFGHLHFLMAKDIVPLLYNDLIARLGQANA